jgi:hypothetical protein
LGLIGGGKGKWFALRREVVPWCDEFYSKHPRVADAPTEKPIVKCEIGNFAFWNSARLKIPHSGTVPGWLQFRIVGWKCCHPTTEML